MKKPIKKAVSLLPKVLGVLLLFVVVGLFFLYAMGYYDFTFIKRPEPQKEPDVTAPVPNTPSPDTEPPETVPPVTEPPKTEPPIITAPVVEIDPSEFLTIEEAGAEGYYLTSLPYSADKMIIAELRTRVECTDDFTLRTRYWERPTYVYESQFSSADLVWKLTEEAIPALEAYMGYIFADAGNTIYVYDSYGRHLGYFNPTEYTFAYKRDKEGRPLFVRPYTITVWDEAGEESVDVHEFEYFYMDETGTIQESDYNDATDNRGIMADYPGYYGVFESDFERECVYSRVVQKNLKGKLESFIRTRWTILKDGDPLTDTEYFAAFPYSNGYACVTDEEGTMFFIDVYGNKTFETKREYYHSDSYSEGRYVIERLLLPLDESTALGCYYYDHGLVMARRQIYDKYQLEDWDVDFVLYDEYVILHTDGTEFPIPEGYTVKSYSDGVILLEKDGTYGYMDYTGAWLGRPDYEDAKPFMEGLAVCKKNGRWGVIDTTGTTVIPFLYDYIQSPSSGIIICHSEIGWNTYVKMAK